MFLSERFTRKPERSVSCTDYQTILALHHLNSAIRRRIEHSQTKQELDHLAGVYGWVMGYLSDHEDEDIYQRDLERAFSMCKSGVSKTLAALEKNRLIERTRVASDDRLKKIILTTRGKALTERIRADNEQLEADLTRDFSPEELKALQDYLLRMQNNITDPGKEQ